MKPFDQSSKDASRRGMNQKWFVITFAIVEAVVIGWFLLSDRLR